MAKYDVIVVGAGPAGIFACYELTLKAPQAKVLLVEKGNDILHRSCPIKEGKIQFCPLPGEIKLTQAVCRHARLLTGLAGQALGVMESLTLQQSSAAG